MPAVGHVHLKVSDLDRSEAFYRDALGLEVTERVGGSFVFMSFGGSHHHLALQGHPDGPPADPAAPGLYHFAVEVEDESELAEAVDRSGMQTSSSPPSITGSPKRSTSAI